MIAIIDAIHTTAIFVLAGGAAFPLLFGSPTGSLRLAPQFIYKRILVLVQAGVGLLAIAWLLRLLACAKVDAGLLSMFSIEGLLAIAIAVLVAYSGKISAHIFSLLLLALAFGLIGIQIAGSSSAVAAGALPGFVASAHWLAAAFWAGPLLFLNGMPWPAIERSEQRREIVGAFASTYSRMTLAMFVLMLLTGGILAFVHVHNHDALQATTYGHALQIKILLVALLAVSVCATMMRIVPELCGAADNAASSQSVRTRFRRAILFDLIILSGLIGTTGFMATREPPGLPPFLNPQTWEITAGEIPLTLGLQPVAGNASRARLEISAESTDALPDGTLADFSLRPLSAEEPRYEMSAIPVGPAEFLGEVVLVTPGDWKLDLRFTYPDGQTIYANHLIELPAPPLQNDLHSYLSATTAFYGTNNVTLVVGLLLVASAIFLFEFCRRRGSPLWLMPINVGTAAFGGLLVLSVTFVKTYPSTFTQNPEPFTAESVRAGETLYYEHCADCHGVSGLGDGPWAKANRSPLPSLAGPHIDVHTDGEIYWWITYGIPSLDMPPLADELTERDRWTIINVVRSFRHQPPVESTDGNRYQSPSK